MIYLSGRISENKNIGLMLSYNANKTSKNMAIHKDVIAIDNGCFSQPGKYTNKGYLNFLKHLNRKDSLFAVAPDVVADAAATKIRSLPILREIRKLGYKAAYVGQDGEFVNTVYWDEFDCLFIGGSTDWKLSQYAGDLIMAAKSKNKWVHMGRVNSWQRIRVAYVLGCDSVDGTYIAFAPDKNTKNILNWLKKINEQPNLF